jgi:hypothetical protein
MRKHSKEFRFYLKEATSDGRRRPHEMDLYHGRPSLADNLERKIYLHPGVIKCLL